MVGFNFKDLCKPNCPWVINFAYKKVFHIEEPHDNASFLHCHYHLLALERGETLLPGAAHHCAELLFTQWIMDGKRKKLNWRVDCDIDVGFSVSWINYLRLLTTLSIKFLKIKYCFASYCHLAELLEATSDRLQAAVTISVKLKAAMCKSFTAAITFQ